MEGGRLAALVLSGAVAVGAAVTPAAPATASVHGTVNSPAVPLKARTGPARWYPEVSQLPHGSVVQPVCQIRGQRLSGTERSTDMWDRLPDGSYIFDGYVRRQVPVPPCSSAKAAAKTARNVAVWTHPLPGFPAQGGFRTPHRPTHRGVDLMTFPGTPVRAAAAGTVLEVVCDIQPGGSCDVPGSPQSRGCGWYVKIGHPGQIATLYCHLQRQPPVQPGQTVGAGQVIGLAGSSGRSSFPHLHFEVHVNAPPTSDAAAVDPLVFMASVGAPMRRRAG